jgi:hypothetical protein
MPSPGTVYGRATRPLGETLMRESLPYPERTADELGLTDYFRANTNVAGMAWGGGMNNSPKDEPRVVVANPFNPYMTNPTAYQGLLKLEASRHLMDEQGYSPQFDITPMQQEWRKTLGKEESGKAYAEDDLAFKRSIVSRLIVNSSEVPDPTPKQRAAAEYIMQQLSKRRATK